MASSVLTLFKGYGKPDIAGVASWDFDPGIANATARLVAGPINGTVLISNVVSSSSGSSFSWLFNVTPEDTKVTGKWTAYLVVTYDDGDTGPIKLPCKIEVVDIGYADASRICN